MEEDHKDLLEIGDGVTVQSRGIVSESVPHAGEWRHYEMENGHS